MHFFEQSLQCSMSEPISTTSASSTCQCASRLLSTLTRSDLASARAHSVHAITGGWRARGQVPDVLRAGGGGLLTLH